jgi:hypothetical protein
VPVHQALPFSAGEAERRRPCPADARCPSACDRGVHPAGAPPDRREMRSGAHGAAPREGAAQETAT